MELGVTNGDVLQAELGLCMLELSFMATTLRWPAGTVGCSATSMVKTGSPGIRLPETKNIELSTLLTVKACGNNREAGFLLSQTVTKKIQTQNHWVKNVFCNSMGSTIVLVLWNEKCVFKVKGHQFSDLVIMRKDSS